MVKNKPKATIKISLIKKFSEKLPKNNSKAKTNTIVISKKIFLRPTEGKKNEIPKPEITSNDGLTKAQNEYFWTA